MPSASYLVQYGVMAAMHSDVSRQERPAMEPESSIKKMVSKVARKENGSSSTFAGVGLLLDGAVARPGDGTDAGWSDVVEYGGGASLISLKGLFMLGRFAGLLVVGEPLV